MWLSLAELDPGLTLTVSVPMVCEFPAALGPMNFTTTLALLDVKLAVTVHLANPAVAQSGFDRTVIA